MAYPTPFPAASLPDWLVRGRTQTVSAWLVEQGGASNLIPSAATFTLLNPSGTAVVDGAAATVASTTGIATREILSTLLPATLDLGEGWQERWLFTVAGEPVEVIRDAALCRWKPQPTLTDDNLLQKHAVLRSLLTSGKCKSLAGYREAAWEKILRRLLRDARYPYLVLSPWALREVEEGQTLGDIFMDQATSMQGGQYERLANAYLDDQMEAKAWRTVRMTYDEDRDGRDGGTEERHRSADPIVYLGGAPGSWYGRPR